MKRIDGSQLHSRPRPTERVIQFGEGNFLRAFMDWKIDHMNADTGSDFGIVVVRPIDGGIPVSLNDSDGVYTVLSRGVGEDGEAVSVPRVIAAVLRELSAVQDWQEVLGLARNPDIEVVISNTTEAGIHYQEGCRPEDEPPATFPAKVTRMLWERYRSLGEAEAPGFQFLPCELIDHNGDTLEKCVFRHAGEWALDDAFINWVKQKNAFYNTLVDRIVPGYPRDEAADLEAVFGYEDPLMVATELFHLLVVEKRKDQPDLVMPLAQRDEGTIIVANADGYKERKVAILNGAHTGLCPLALLSGTVSVRNAMQNAAANRFLLGMLETEIMPYLSLPQDELRQFAADVLRRFANPFILHRWYDISLNGIAKFRTRNLPRFLAHWDETGKPPRHMGLSLAAWLAFYIGAFEGADALPPRDAEDILARFDILKAKGHREGTRAMVAAYLDERAFWHESLAQDDLTDLVADAYEFLTSEPFTLDRLKGWTDD